ncbi:MULTISPECIES: DNA topoisomerase IV [unclassified Gemella]|uniref:DNA topoisomerase IV n=1 Tax=unclassified Gemella TaxID=2624949 RepID=UPI001073EFE7|nr:MULTISPECIES: DNA topoisomerase IV [unclassified Gemella]MBF0709709.1 DNA topoisomerase IV [Gemella sp. GL1.1]MBF0746873.1 DNA topoisomerase IV [Gemella sp. 19428wG2_WT2a]NYS27053.1 DNA topoisomerase IV [Gemella sp. GL1]TFU59103.1 DNA topoisomerase IV [Gemella sp. WT2a]
MYYKNLSNLESPHLIYSDDDEYSQDFDTEIDYEDEILSDYADESFNSNELINDRYQDDFNDYSDSIGLTMEYSYDEDDFEYDEVGISNDQMMLEDASDEDRKN